MPYRHIDEQEDKKDEISQAENKLYEDICDQLLNGGVAGYHDKSGTYRLAFLDKILEGYESGMSTKDVIEAEAKRIAESIF